MSHCASSLLAGDYLGAHAAAVNAFEAHGHRANLEAGVSPYALAVDAGLTYLFNKVDVEAANGH